MGNAAREVITHSTIVITPIDFTTTRLQQMFLTRRHATRMLIPTLIQVRRDRQVVAAVAAPAVLVAESACIASPVRTLVNWGALSSVALMLVIVVLAVAATGLRL
jgi:hypothetical protein